MKLSPTFSIERLQLPATSALRMKQQRFCNLSFIPMFRGWPARCDINDGDHHADTCCHSSSSRQRSPHSLSLVSKPPGPARLNKTFLLLVVLEIQLLCAGLHRIARSSTFCPRQHALQLAIGCSMHYSATLTSSYFFQDGAKYRRRCGTKQHRANYAARNDVHWPL